MSRGAGLRSFVAVVFALLGTSALPAQEFSPEQVFKTALRVEGIVLNEYSVLEGSLLEVLTGRESTRWIRASDSTLTDLSTAGFLTSSEEYASLAGHKIEAWLSRDGDGRALFLRSRGRASWRELKGLLPEEVAWGSLLQWSDRTCRAQLQNLAAAVEMYREDHGGYPPGEFRWDGASVVSRAGYIKNPPVCPAGEKAYRYRLLPAGTLQGFEVSCPTHLTRVNALDLKRTRDRR